MGRTNNIRDFFIMGRVFTVNFKFIGRYSCPGQPPVQEPKVKVESRLGFRFFPSAWQVGEAVLCGLNDTA